MSRCFPYPPPGYCRNGGEAPHQALIDSIKLQKETDKAKAERRKEKKLKKERKEKKKEEKEKRKNEEKLKSQKDQSEVSHKLLQKEAGVTEAEINGKKPNTEVLEKSDLTEESGQPIKPSYSSDSTQNSNKRRRDDNDNDDVLLQDDSTGHGKHIKIRLLMKLKESDPTTSSGEDVRLKAVSIPPPRRENNAAQRAPLTQTKSNGLRLSREPSPSSSARPILPSGSRKSDVEALKPSSSLSRQQQLQQQQKHQQIASFARPVVSESQLKHDILSSSASRNISLQGPSSARPGPVQSKPSPITTGKRPVNEISVAGNISFQSKPSPITTGKRPVNEIPVACNISFQSKPSPITTGKRPVNEIPVSGNISFLNKPNPIATGKRPVNEIPVSGNISLLNKPSSIATGKRPINDAPVPGTSGPTNLGKRKEHSEKPGPSRAEKKMMKKHAKYEKLIGSWVPPPAFQALLPQVVNDEEDWLSRRAKPASLSVSKSEVETCGAGETGLWQPRARFLPEADIHALPYTIPF